MKEHKTAVAMAAAMAFVFIGTYGLIRQFIERKSREPAQQQRLNQAPAPGAGLSNVASEPVTTPSEGLGSGRNKVSRPRANIPEAIQEASQYSKVVPGMPNPPIAAPQPENQEPPREPPQYYSTGEDPNGQQVAVGTPPADYNPNVNTDPNAGVVNPPGFVPQPQNNGFPAGAAQTPDQGQNSPFPPPNPSDQNLDPNNPPQNNQF